MTIDADGISPLDAVPQHYATGLLLQAVLVAN
jgi:hypothetical protein